jgi:hypothetical protein
MSLLTSAATSFIGAEIQLGAVMVGKDWMSLFGNGAIAECALP